MRRAIPSLPGLVVLAAVAASAALSAPARADDQKQQCLSSSDQGQSLRDDGKYRRAREAFASCARDVCPTIVRRDCMKWLAELEQSWPSVVIGAKDEGGADLVNVTVLVDGAPLVSRLDGNPTMVDPGEHLFRFETAGYPAVEKRIVVRAGEKSRLLAVQFAHAPSAAPPPPSTAAEPKAAADQARSPQATRASAWVFAGLSAVAFGTEAYFGLTGLSDRSHLRSEPCAQTSSCPPSSVDSIRTKFTVADIALGVGIASAAIATYLFLAGPKVDAAPPTTSVDLAPVPGGGAMSVGGRF
ncbi:MAG: hypothetical protein ACRELB_09855 [Polyangiaceae bacterium]